LETAIVTVANLQNLDVKTACKAFEVQHQQSWQHLTSDETAETVEAAERGRAAPWLGIGACCSSTGPSVSVIESSA